MTTGGSGTTPLSTYSVRSESSDLEVGGGVGVSSQHQPHYHHEEDDNEDQFDDPFDIGNTKNASVQSLKRWRVWFYSCPF